MSDPYYHCTSCGLELLDEEVSTVKAGHNAANGEFAPCPNCKSENIIYRGDDEDVIATQNTPIDDIKVISINTPTIWVEFDMMGNHHVMISHCGNAPNTFFCYCSFYYDYSFTSNAAIKTQAEKMAESLGATKPINYKLRDLDLTSRVNITKDQASFIIRVLSLSFNFRARRDDKDKIASAAAQKISDRYNVLTHNLDFESSATQAKIEFLMEFANNETLKVDGYKTP